LNVSQAKKGTIFCNSPIINVLVGSKKTSRESFRLIAVSVDVSVVDVYDSDFMFPFSQCLIFVDALSRPSFRLFSLQRNECLSCRFVQRRKKKDVKGSYESKGFLSVECVSIFA